MNTNRERVAADMKAVEAKLRQANAELDELRAAKQLAQRNAQTIQSLNSRISIAEKKIKALQEERTSVEDIKAASARQIQVNQRFQSCSQ